jgi:DGQHR domain-containing protein
MKRLELDVVKSQSLGYEVYRGSIKARDLYPALWIDMYDPVDNSEGYQRPFNESWSQDAADYAEREETGFWPECILSIRAELDQSGERKPVVSFSYSPLAADMPHFGQLTVDYDETSIRRIGQRTVPWDRAFSQVDCQHRLGKMAASDKYVTVCVFEKLTRYEEAIIFRVINEKQHKISTSLVDEIIFKIAKKSGKGHLFEPEIAWASELNEDPYSPFYQKVFTGAPMDSVTVFVRLRTLRACMEAMLGRKRIDEAVKNLDLGESQREKNYKRIGEFVRNFWVATKELWPAEWRETEKEWKRYKLLTSPGLLGLSMVANRVFDECRRSDDYSLAFIKGLLKPAVGWVDWDRTSGTFAGLTGKAGANRVRDKIREKVLPETII